ncbi:MAG: DUF4215 domain-containing protein [Polyangiaceae bacterium]|nr:DUF4215 domain-containing protein [Polyangiaceae bacterium]
MSQMRWLALGAVLAAAFPLASACSHSSDTSAPAGGVSGASNVGGNAAVGGSGEVFMFFPNAGASSGGAGGMCADSSCMGPEHACGDARLDAGEKCDDGNITSADGCSANCEAVEKDFACPTPGKACVSTVACGDGKITGSETCDDKNTVAGDGCDASCKLESGWACPMLGARCIAALCGDGVVAGFETCDDGNGANGDGCSSACELESGFKCVGLVCSRTVCGDGVKEGTEQCDDGNFDTGDGCSPLCTNEPRCQNGVCQAVCGDGIKLSQEECDDANTRNFDGCSDQCKVEAGFTCEIERTPPQLPAVYRDFIGTTDTGSNANVPGNDGAFLHPDFQKYNGCEEDVEPVLDMQGKPVLKTRNSPGRSSGNCVESAQSFAQWYRSDPLVNRSVVSSITLNPLDPNAANPTVFEFFDTTFFPLDGLGFNAPNDLKEQARSGGHNFHFTSEVRYWFTYAGGEKLTFYGDDDVWVFINRKLAADIAGVHGKRERSITLGASTSGDAETFGYFDAQALGLTVGGVYEVVVFQAERHTTASQYKLTLENFLSAKSVCKSTCGDGKLASNEGCDEGASNDGRYNGCTASCTLAPHCGDATVQSASGEACDDGTNLTTHAATKDSLACAPGCKKPSYCGDGVVDSLFGEACDNGVNDGSYGTCTATCSLAPRCGDKIIQPEFEQCDDANSNSADGCTPSCRIDAPR